MWLSLLVSTVNLPPPPPAPPTSKNQSPGLCLWLFQTQGGRGGRCWPPCAPGRSRPGSRRPPRGLHPRARPRTLLFGDVLGEPPCPSLTDMYWMWLWPCWSSAQASSIVGVSDGAHVRRARQEGTPTRTRQLLLAPTGPGASGGPGFCGVRGSLVQPTLPLVSCSLASLNTFPVPALSWFLFFRGLWGSLHLNIRPWPVLNIANACCLLRGVCVWGCPFKVFPSTGIFTFMSTNPAQPSPVLCLGVLSSTPLHSSQIASILPFTLRFAVFCQPAGSGEMGRGQNHQLPSGHQRALPTPPSCLPS